MAQIRQKFAIEHPNDSYSSDSFSKLVNEEMAIHYAAEDDIAAAYTSHLLAQADRLMVPHPQDAGDWVKGRTKPDALALSPTALAALRDAIRKERKERSEVARLWVGAIAPIVAALTGLIGVLIGFLAALHG